MPIALVVLFLILLGIAIFAFSSVYAYKWLKTQRQQTQQEEVQYHLTEEDVTYLNNVMASMSDVKSFVIEENYQENTDGVDILFTATQKYEDGNMTVIDGEYNDACKEKYLEGNQKITDGVCAIAMLPEYCVDVHYDVTTINTLSKGEYDGGEFTFEQMITNDKQGRIIGMLTTLDWSNSKSNIHMTSRYTNFKY